MAARYKLEKGMPILDAQREALVIRNGAARVADEGLRGYYVDFMRETMAISRRYQQRLLERMKDQDEGCTVLDRDGSARLLEQILHAIENIRVGDETIGRAARRYEQRWAVMGGAR